MCSQMTAAYAAGLIDGEGCISVAHRMERIYYPRVDVGMSIKGLPVLEALKKRYGGAINVTRQATEKWEGAHAWRIFGEPLLRFLEEIEPHLILKKEQARHAISLQSMILRLPKNGGSKWTPEATRIGRTIRALVMELNRKGPTHTETAGWFAKLAGATWITPQRDLVSPNGWGEFSGPWPRSGMMRNGIAYRLPTLAHRMSGTASGSWPTPTARDWKDTPGMKLESRNKDGTMRDRADQLARRVYLVEQTPPGGGLLTPEFCEWLMGFPIGFTELKR
jgi:hypothetical protein